MATTRSTGANLPRLNPTTLADFDVPLPPLEEQKRIAAILDQADEIRRLRQRAISRLNTLGQEIFYEMFGDPSDPTNNTPRMKIGDCCAVSSGATPSRKVPENFGGDIPWVKTTEVDGRRISETSEHVTNVGKERARLCLFPAGTVLIAMYGQGKTRGQAGMLTAPATTNQACAAIQCGDLLRPTFLFEQIKILYKSIRRLGQGGNQPNLTSGLIRNFEVLTPPLDIQDRFVEAMFEIEGATEADRRSAENLEKLFVSVQDRAFRGDL